MRIPSRAASRLALAGCLILTGLFSPPSGRAASPPEATLPSSTIALVKVDDASALRAAFRRSQIGQLWADPALKPLKDDLAAKLEDANKKLKEKLGVTIADLLDLPQGPASLALVARDDPKVPVAFLLSADAGKNADAMQEVMTKATKQAEESGGGKVATETFKDLTLHVIRSTKEGEKDAPPVIWTRQKGIFHVATDADVLKDLVSHADGRNDSLAANESFIQIQKKLGKDAQATWFVDLAQILRLVTQNAPGGNPAQFEAQFQLLGINGLKGIGGSLAFNVGEYDQLGKVYILAPGPAQGVLKLFEMPKVSLKPEGWVPASVATYQTFSWDLDHAYTAISDLAATFGPLGGLENFEKQLVGPDGGEPLSLQKDVFGPLGDRVSILSDYKKPITEKSQRMLLAVALEDAPAFQKTLNRLIALAQGAPKKREFQGTTIYDFDVPNADNPNVAFKGPISVAVAKKTLFAATDPSLLEQVLRTGGPALVDSPGYQAVAKQIPEKVSLMSYERPEEQARLLYDMVKTGQLQKAIENANANNPDAPKVGNFIDTDKIPEFSVFAKYLSPGGSYGLQEEDGMSLIQFSLRKANP